MAEGRDMGQPSFYQASFEDLCKIADFEAIGDSGPLFRYSPKAEETYQDFGKKIGGARKDKWRARGLQAADLEYMNAAERNRYVVKDNVWPKPDYKKLVESGTPRLVAYYCKTMRDRMPCHPTVPKPELMDPEAIARREKEYVDIIGAVRDAVMSTGTADRVGRDLRGELSHVMSFGYSNYGPFFSDRNSPEAILFRGRRKGYLCLSGITVSHLSYEMDRREWCMGLDGRIDGRYRFLQIGRCLDSGPQYTFSTSLDHAWGTLTLKASPYDTKSLVLCPEHSCISFKLPDMTMDEALSKMAEGSWLAVEITTRHRAVVAMGRPTLESARQAAAMDLTQADGQAKAQRRKVRAGDLKPPVLESIVRQAPSECQWLVPGRHASSEQYLDEFHFAGGEYGNWVNGPERMANLDAAYEALKDLALALGIADSDIGFDGSLSIAFGARGHGGPSAALAHYEPLRQVINLTKMRGAGSLAHEWIHAMDDIVGKRLVPYSCGGSRMLSNHSRAVQPKAMADLIDALKWKTGPDGARVHTDYLEYAKELDKGRSKPYWATNHEMLARAGELYVFDRLKSLGIRDDYLCGHAEFGCVPKGDERHAINQAFEAFFAEMKEDGNLKPRAPERGLCLNGLETKAAAIAAMPDFGVAREIGGGAR